ncbi:hypothetical protein [Desulfovibrio aminophilus]|uniref:hypothetical protein n=1 Tax=Desulfovibrio aminophilus TaxID=81425 RepID=UPI00041C4E40|nr:hypothetical protein [Desulfovibrio aminophilus]
MNTINRKKPTRQQLFRAWMLQNGLDLSDLAGQLGVTKQRLSALMGQKQACKRIRERLLQIGIPEELIPEPVVTKRQALAENRALRARLAELEPGSGTAA